MKILYLLTFGYTFCFAYLDPASGSLLLSSIVALFASLIFFLRGIVYKFSFLTKQIRYGGGAKQSLNPTPFNQQPNKQHTNKQHGKHYGIVIYSEGKQYYAVFKPILDFLDSKQYPYAYFASSKDDGIFQRNTIANPYAIIEFIGDSNKAFVRLNSLSADIVLMTTPQLDVLQIKRSKGVKHYCHILHSLPHVDIYEIFALDYFDSVFINSPIHIDFIRQVEEKRKLHKKQIHIIGCTYLDEFQNKLYELQKHNDNLIPQFFKKQDSATPVILLSPSWGRESILHKYGMEIIEPLGKSNYNIIIRPHPQTLISKPDFIESLKLQSAKYTNIKWDTNVDNIYAMNEADLMIGDFSGIIFDFICLFAKPVITMEFDFNIIGYDLEDIYQTPWVKDILPQIGKSINKAEFPHIESIIQSILTGESNTQIMQNIHKLKQSLWHYQGKSGELSGITLLKIHSEILRNKLEDSLSIHENLIAIDNILMKERA